MLKELFYPYGKTYLQTLGEQDEQKYCNHPQLTEKRSCRNGQNQNVR